MKYYGYSTKHSIKHNKLTLKKCHKIGIKKF